MRQLVSFIQLLELMRISIVKRYFKVVLLITLVLSIPIRADDKVQFLPDEDNNGIRDDLDVYIQETYGDRAELKLFLLDYTRLFQNIVINNEDKAKV